MSIMRKRYRENGDQDTVIHVEEYFNRKQIVDMSPEERDFIIQEDGALIFRKQKTAYKLPAGEYIPERNRNEEAILVPVKRTNTTEATHSILSNKLDNALNIQKPTIKHWIGDEDLRNLEDALCDNADTTFNSDNNLNKSMAGQSDFMPVHSYFPMEKYSRGLMSARENINRFLESEPVYKKLKMDYRRAVLLYGDPGTGKSQFIYQLSRELIDSRDAIVVRIENQRALDTFAESVAGALSGYTDRLKVVVIEELADLCSSRGNVSQLLSLLDSMIFRHNVLFLITTNHPDRIPSNIVDRPSRLDLLCPIYNRDLDATFVDAWFGFCMSRDITDVEKQTEWYRHSKGTISPAYFKELFIYSQIHGISLDEAWAVIVNRREEIERDFREERHGIGFSL